MVVKTVVTRRRFIKALSAAGVVGAVSVNGLYEANRPVVNEVAISLRRLPLEFDSFKIAQLSDFHFDSHFSVHAIRSGVVEVNTLGADLVVLTGDFVTAPIGKRFASVRERAISQARSCAELLSKLESKFGSVAVLGNHDWSVDAERITEILESHNITVLRNSSFPLRAGNTRLWIAGADSFPEFGNLAKTLEGVPKGEPTVLLVHEPDAADQVREFDVDLQLSGHSHGGQVCLPLVGPLYLPELGRKYPRGLRQVKHLQVYTNVGIGTLGAPIRLNCPPEVTLITLRKALS